MVTWVTSPINLKIKPIEDFYRRRVWSSPWFLLIDMHNQRVAGTFTHFKYTHTHTHTHTHSHFKYTFISNTDILHLYRIILCA